MNEAKRKQLLGRAEKAKAAVEDILSGKVKATDARMSQLCWRISNLEDEVGGLPQYRRSNKGGFAGVIGRIVEVLSR